ncbi:MAG: hypothetical protein WBG57_12800, partial [Ornithinimicrobium sp.]
MNGSVIAAGILITVWTLGWVLAWWFSQRPPALGPVAAVRRRRWGQAALPALPLGCLYFVMTNHASAGV